MLSDPQQDVVCATGDFEYVGGGYRCRGCGRVFQARAINVHQQAARRRNYHRSVVVK